MPAPTDPLPNAFRMKRRLVRRVVAMAVVLGLPAALRPSAGAAERPNRDPHLSITCIENGWPTHGFAPVHFRVVTRDVRVEPERWTLMASRGDSHFGGPDNVHFSVGREVVFPRSPATDWTLYLPANRVDPASYRPDYLNATLRRTRDTETAAVITSTQFVGGEWWTTHGSAHPTPPLLFVSQDTPSDQQRSAHILQRQGFAVQLFDKHRNTPLDRLPASWRGYAGMFARIALTPDVVDALTPEQRAALVDWVVWSGGRLWIVHPAQDGARDDDDAKKTFDPAPLRDAARRLGFALDRLAPDAPRHPHEERYGVRTGRLVLADPAHTRKPHRRFGPEPSGPAVADPGRADPPAVHPTAPTGLFPWNATGENPAFNSLFADIRAGLSPGLIGVLLAAFGLLLGPVNFHIVRRRKQPLLFFFTTPLLALAGMALVGSVAVLLEGVGTRRHEAVLLALDEDADPSPGGSNAFHFNARVVYAGFLTPRVRFPDDNRLVYPIRRRLNTSAAPVPHGPVRPAAYEKRPPYLTRIDTDGSVHLDSGWIVPRERSGLLVARPLAARAPLEGRQVDGDAPDGGYYEIVNHADASLLHVALRLPDGRVVTLDERVPPGGRRLVPLVPDNPGDEENAPPPSAAPDDGRRRHADATHALARHPVGLALRDTMGLYLAALGDAVRLAAEFDGPVHPPEDDGIGGVVEKGRYFYLALSDPHRRSPDAAPPKESP